ncbi:hypothetical protein MLD38_009989 [Melastoma candidum]|uniref:Uncharacterized protein n=1 Tax=Melastoma candidum TaxID=119954 RepID=A0ACB9QZG4_9MYRT|nr:hypothetical protein MLD38_009989 [Melastoma candidum]
MGEIYGGGFDLIRPMTMPTEADKPDFPRGIGPRPLGFKSEASRESAVVIMNHINLVELLRDVNQWSSAFCGIVSRAMTIEVLSTGVAGELQWSLTSGIQILRG